MIKTQTIKFVVINNKHENKPYLNIFLSFQEVYQYIAKELFQYCTSKRIINPESRAFSSVVDRLLFFNDLYISISEIRDEKIKEIWNFEEGELKHIARYFDVLCINYLIKEYPNLFEIN